MIAVQPFVVMTNLPAFFQTSNALIWILYCLANHPHAQQKLFDEIETVLGGSDVIDAETLKSVPYVKACLKETFR